MSSFFADREKTMPETACEGVFCVSVERKSMLRPG